MCKRMSFLTDTRCQDCTCYLKTCAGRLLSPCRIGRHYFYALLQTWSIRSDVHCHTMMDRTNILQRTWTSPKCILLQQSPSHHENAKERRKLLQITHSHQKYFVTYIPQSPSHLYNKRVKSEYAVDLDRSSGYKASHQTVYLLTTLALSKSQNYLSTLYETAYTNKPIVQEFSKSWNIPSFENHQEHRHSPAYSIFQVILFVHYTSKSYYLLTPWPNHIVQTAYGGRKYVVRLHVTAIAIHNMS